MPSAGHIVTLDTRDGYPLSYRVWGSPSDRRATLVLTNGIMSHSGWFDPLAEKLAARKIYVVGADRRGSGVNTVARGDAPNAAQLVEDARAIIEKERDHRTHLFLAGWCWGAVLATNVALEMSKELAGLALLAPGMWPTALLKTRMSEELARKKGLAEDAPELVSPIVEEMFTAGPALEAFIKRDVHRLMTFTPRFHAINGKMSVNAAVRLKTLELPLLLVSASDDDATDNADTLRAFSKLPEERWRHVELTSKHGMQFDAPDALADTLFDWMGAIK